jgi:hypothetical protein
MAHNVVARSSAFGALRLWDDGLRNGRLERSDQDARESD